AGGYEKPVDAVGDDAGRAVANVVGDGDAARGHAFQQCHSLTFELTGHESERCGGELLACLWVVAMESHTLGDLEIVDCLLQPRLGTAASVDVQCDSRNVGVGDGSNRVIESFHARQPRSEEHTSELQSRFDLVCRLLLEKKKMMYLEE